MFGPFGRFYADLVGVLRLVQRGDFGFEGSWKLFFTFLLLITGHLILLPVAKRALANLCPPFQSKASDLVWK
jgi:hypothetical protein